MQHSRPSIPWQIKRLILSPLSSAFLSSVRPMIFTDALKGTAESFLLFPFQARVLRPDCAISNGYELSLYFYFASFHDASKNAPNGLVVLFKLSHSPRIPDVILRAICSNFSCSFTYPTPISSLTHRKAR